MRRRKSGAKLMIYRRIGVMHSQDAEIGMQAIVKSAS
jgi:hypothetical protein